MRSIFSILTTLFALNLTANASNEVNTYRSIGPSTQCSAQLTALRFLAFKLEVSTSLVCSFDNRISGTVTSLPNAPGQGGHGFLPTENSEQCIDSGEADTLMANAYAFAAAAQVDKIEIRKFSCQYVGFYGYRLEFNWSGKRAKDLNAPKTSETPPASEGPKFIPVIKDADQDQLDWDERFG